MSSLLIEIMLVSQIYGNWPMWGGTPTHESVQLMKGAITSPVIKWRVATEYMVELQFSAIADVDGDGHVEVVISSGDGACCLRGSDGTQKWALTIGGWSSPALADVDGDGQMEVVIGSLDNKVYCLRGSNGTQKWAFTTGYSVISSPAIADCDGDGQMEVVIGSLDNKVYCLRGSDGTQKWAFTTGDLVWSSPAIADVDGDGQMEVVIGSLDNKVYCLRGSDGTQKWAFTTWDDVLSSPAIADVDGDGQMEVVIGSYDHNVYCLRGSDGTQKWAFTTGDLVWSSPAIADVDGDGQMEVVIGSDDKKVYCLRGSNGTQKWAASFPSSVHLPGALADVDGDGKFEFLVSQLGVKPNIDNLYCLNAEDGSVAWNIPLAFDVHSPFAGDIDRDGCIEIITGTNEADASGYRIFALDDPANATGCGPVYEDIEEDHGSGPIDFRSIDQGLYLFMPCEAQVSLSLYDAQGRLVQNLYEGLLSPGGHTFIPKTETKGVYLAVLRYQGGIQTVKLIR
ncbi:MAG: FG-GAP-like repeat-containing protein [candidate division WOR-3 bacterium]